MTAGAQPPSRKLGSHVLLDGWRAPDRVQNAVFLSKSFGLAPYGP